MAPKRKSESSDGSASKKRKAITMEVKLDIVKRSEKGESATNIGHVLGLSRSTVATIIKDKDRILEHVKGSAPMKSTVITKQRSGIMIEMERLLVLWLEDQHQRHIPVSLTLIQEKAKQLFEEIKHERGEGSEEFVASRGWFMRFKARANLHNLKVQDEAAGREMLPSLKVSLLASSSTQDTSGNISVSKKGLSAAKNITVDKTFTTKGLAEGFSMVEDGLAKFQAEDPSDDRFSKVYRDVMGALQCYRQILEEKKSSTFQTSLKQFFMKVERPATDPVPSTSAASRGKTPVVQIESSPESPACSLGNPGSPDAVSPAPSAGSPASPASSSQ
ncbi:uncharacterized protein [Saccopteryx bilineata]|uniref:uncharacterized protein n=1 Tax=Saccopteryx bilineata TaxID=59482 RepID=UPI00338ED9BB